MQQEKSQQKWLKEEDPLFKHSPDQNFAAARPQQGWNLRDYCNKLFHIRQMDIEYNFAQIFYALFAPSKLYMHTKWRKRIFLRKI